eukprot:augustus_masked-scaffold_11-processed-gene-6.66-mRNA-1 protein AED:0.74 eAED:0.79 QI:0/0/0/1/1/1/2/0/757
MVQFCFRVIVENINIVDLESSRVLFKVENDDAKFKDMNKDSDVDITLSKFTTFSVSFVENEICTLFAASSNQVLATLKLSETGAQKTKSWKGHHGPILSSDFHDSGRYVCTGSADFTIKVWDVFGGFCTHNFKLKGAVSVVMNVAFCQNSGTGDMKVIASNNAGRLIAEVQIENDSLEALSITGGNLSSIDLVLGGEQGVLYFVKFTGTELKLTDKVIISQNNGISELSYNTLSQQLICADHDSIISFLKVGQSKPRIVRQVSGGLDEVLDIHHFVSEERHKLAVASNSTIVQVVDLVDFSAEFLRGHTESVLSLTTNLDGEFILSGSKDNTIRVWVRSEQNEYYPIFTCKGHTDSVSGLGFVANMEDKEGSAVGLWRQCLPNAQQVIKNKKFIPIFVSGSFDKTIKLWGMSPSTQNKAEIVAIDTVVAHEKLINDVDVSPNRSLFASCSMDKTIKLWQVVNKEVKPVCTLVGHRRGVWSINFNVKEKLLVSASGDKSLKVWNLGNVFKKDTVSSMLTLQGQETSAIKARFLKTSRKIVSTSSDGLVRVWDLSKSAGNECISVIDNHEDRVWALESLIYCEQEIVVSGGADGKISIYDDFSKDIERKELEEKEEIIRNEERMRDLEREGKLLKACQLALQLNRPQKLKYLFGKLFGNSSTPQSNEILLIEFLTGLEEDQLSTLFTFLKEWNTSAHSCGVSQYLLNAVLKRQKLRENIPPNFSEPFVAYSNRHLRRIDNLIQDTYLIDHALSLLGSFD